MKRLTVTLPGHSYDILIAPGLLLQAGERIRAVCPQAGTLFVVTDTNVGPLYGEAVRQSLEAAGSRVVLHTVPAGERSKNADQLSRLWEAMAHAGLTRTDAVIALGGGVVGDLAGFAAATVLRGVDFVQIPTTLLAQVDSSVGGKVAIDLAAGKNLAGAFWQPKLVLMDPNTLTTLPNAVFADGMAEVLKYGCIADRDFFQFLAARPERNSLMKDIDSILYTCCDRKRALVEQDERDTGERRLLNFGHTLGHAYEAAGHYETWTHGQAVAAGMVKAAELGERRGMTPPGVAETIAAACTALGLPTYIDCGKADYATAIGRDKKASGEDISLVLLTELGHAVTHKLPKEEVLALL